MENQSRKLGKIIKVERIKHDLSQEHLAEKAGVSTRSISLIEAGKQHPKFLLVIKLLKILNYDFKNLENEF